MWTHHIYIAMWASFKLLYINRIARQPSPSINLLYHIIRTPHKPKRGIYCQGGSACTTMSLPLSCWFTGEQVFHISCTVNPRIEVISNSSWLSPWQLHYRCEVPTETVQCMKPHVVCFHGNPNDSSTAMVCTAYWIAWLCHSYWSSVAPSNEAGPWEG